MFFSNAQAMTGYKYCTWNLCTPGFPNMVGGQLASIELYQSPHQIFRYLYVQEYLST